jgi:flagellar basal body-associated protein FliL
MQPNDPYGAAPQPSQQPDYGFIMSPNQQPTRPTFPGGSSLRGRIIIVGLGLIVLLILFSIIRGLVVGKPNMQDFVGVAQDQASIIHLVSKAAEEPSLNQQNKNFVYTAQTSMQTTQRDTLTYLRNNKVKVKDKVLILKTSAKTDNDLATAATNSNYNEAFHDVMKAQLETYQQDLQNAYAKTKGPKGRDLLSKSYNSAGLLLTQLETR